MEINENRVKDFQKSMSGISKLEELSPRRFHGAVIYQGLMSCPLLAIVEKLCLQAAQRPQGLGASSKS
jgi:hypothetical protein